MPEPTGQEIKVAQSVLMQVKEKLHDHQMRILHAGVRKQRLAAKYGGRRKTGDMPVKFAIRPEFYHYWGQRLGYECWDDEKFVAEFLRDNPECRVENETGRIMVGGRGESAETAATRNPKSTFHKNYGVWEMPKASKTARAAVA